MFFIFCVLLKYCPCLDIKRCIRFFRLWSWQTFSHLCSTPQTHMHSHTHLHTYTHTHIGPLRRANKRSVADDTRNWVRRFSPQINPRPAHCVRRTRRRFHPATFKPAAAVRVMYRNDGDEHLRARGSVSRTGFFVSAKTHTHK